MDARTKCFPNRKRRAFPLTMVGLLVQRALGVVAVTSLLLTIVNLLDLGLELEKGRPTPSVPLRLLHKLL